MNEKILECTDVEELRGLYVEREKDILPIFWNKSKDMFKYLDKQGYDYTAKKKTNTKNGQHGYDIYFKNSKDIKDYMNKIKILDPAFVESYGVNWNFDAVPIWGQNIGEDTLLIA